MNIVKIIIFIQLIVSLENGGVIFGQIFGSTQFTKILNDITPSLIGDVRRAEFSSDFIGPQNLIVQTMSGNIVNFKAQDGIYTTSSAAVTSSLATKKAPLLNTPQYNQSIAVFYLENVITLQTVSSLLFCQATSTSTPTNGDSLSVIEKKNPILRWSNSTTSNFYSIFTSFTQLSTYMSLITTQWSLPNSQFTPQPAGKNSKQSSIANNEEANFMVVDNIMSKVYLCGGEFVEKYDLDTLNLETTYTLQNTASKTAIAYNGVLYTCTTNITGAYIEKFEGINISVYLLSTNVSNCLNMNYDTTNGLLFVSVSNRPGNLALISITINGKNPSIKSISPSETVDTSSLNSYSYPVGSYSPNLTVSVLSMAGKVYTFQYTPCPNNCSGHGTCSIGECTCNSGWALSDCSIPRPAVSGSSKITYWGTSTVTLTGSNFVNTANYQISICGVSCTAMVFYSDTTITCSLTFEGNQSQTPAESCNAYVSMNSFTSDPFSVSFEVPTFTIYSQVNETISISTINNYPASYLNLSKESSSITPFTTTATSLTFNLPLNSTSGDFVISLKSTNAVISTVNIRIQPYLTEVNPQSLDTHEINPIEISGFFFSANGESTKKLSFGGNYVTSTVSSNKLTFNAPDGIFANKTVQTFDETTGIYSNSLAFKYNAPTITLVTQDQVIPSIITIQGSNFGNSEQLISISPNIYLIYKTVNYSTIIATLPTTIMTSGSYNLIVDGQSATSSLVINLKPSISSITKPSVSGGSVTIVGNYLLETTVYVLRDQLQAQTLICSPCGTSNFPSTLNCEFPSGSGSFQVYSSSASLTSDKLNSTYQSPTITGISPKVYFEEREAQFTITGSNFVNDDLVLQINNEDCAVIQILTNRIVCEITSSIPANTTTNPVPVFLSVKGLSTYSNRTVQYYYKPCLSECAPHGVCNYTTTICECDNGFEGNDCSTSSTTSSSTTTTPSKHSDLASSNQLSVNLSLILLVLTVTIVF